MGKKRLVALGQDLTLLLLALLSVFLISRLPMFRGDLARRVQDLLAASPSGGEQDPDDRLEDIFPAVHLAVTGESEYGRCLRMYAGSGDGLLRQSMPLFREALGSAGEVGATAERAMRQALDQPSLYLDLTEELPLSVVSAWLGESVDASRPVRALALTAGEGDNAVLYLRDDAGDVARCYTALPAQAVLELCEAYPPNGGRFAYDGGYGYLPPYVLIPADAGSPWEIQAALPAGANAYDLLTALDFNAHTLSRYTESSGVEVVEESPRTLRIGPDGTVSFSSRADTGLTLYEVPAAGGAPTALEALRAAQALAEALTQGSGASPLYLRGLEETETGWTVRFRYQVDGLAVLFPDEADALTVTTEGGTIAAFTYRCRRYTRLDRPSTLLPVEMAAAAADSRAGGGLSLGYVDTGAGALSAQWLPR